MAVNGQTNRLNRLIFGIQLETISFVLNVKSPIKSLLIFVFSGKDSQIFTRFIYFYLTPVASQLAVNLLHYDTLRAFYP